VTTCQTVVAASLRGHDPPAQRRSDISYSVARLIPGQGVRPGIVALEAAGEGSCSAVNARVLVPWKSVSDALGDMGGLADGSLTVEVFTGDAPGPDDLGDVVFFTVPYDRPFSTEPIPRLSGVRVVQTLTAGYDHVAALVPGGVTLCTARGLHDSSTAEHALGLILAAQRELPRWVRAQDEGRWEHAHTRSLADCRVLIVGYGSIGSALDARLRACEAETVRVARRARPDEQVSGVAELDGLLPSADIVVLITPLSAETRGLLDARRLALLPEGRGLHRAASAQVRRRAAPPQRRRGAHIRRVGDLNSRHPVAQHLPRSGRRTGVQHADGQAEPGPRNAVATRGTG